jgi:hypothetical protein
MPQRIHRVQAESKDGVTFSNMGNFMECLQLSRPRLYMPENLYMPQNHAGTAHASWGYGAAARQDKDICKTESNGHQTGGLLNPL